MSRLMSVFRRYQKTGDAIPLRPAFAALTIDIIAEYCFGGYENYIEAPGFNSSKFLLRSCPISPTSLSLFRPVSA